MYNPLVSVIIPNYCHAKYLDQRIQSVLNQTYQNFEVIILDDASPDNGASKAVIETYRDNPHVTQIVYNEQNSGSTFKQWNKGFELAKGELIWIAESDDYCELNFLETLVGRWNNIDDISFCFCNISMVDGENRIISNNEIPIKDDRIYDGSNFIVQCELCKNIVRNASGVVFSKDRALSIGKTYMTFKAAGDYLFWIMMAEKGNVVYASETLNYCRVNGKNITDKAISSGLTFVEDYKIHQYLRKRGYINSIKKEFEIRKEYVFWMSNVQMNSEKKRNEVINLWDPYHIIRLWNKIR